MAGPDRVVEPKPNPTSKPKSKPSDARVSDALAYRLRQQSVLADFGLRALEAEGLDALLTAAATHCAEGMRARFCKILEYLPAEDRLFMRAGVGWAPGVVGATWFAVDLDSPAGFAFRTGKPVISNHLAREARFRTPRVLAEHGVKRATNVLIPAEGERPWGVLEVDSRDPGKFDAPDVQFLQSMARLLGIAIARERARCRTQEAERFARALFDAAPDSYIVLSPDFTIEAANDARLRQTMTQRSGMLGKPLFEVFPDNPADPEAHGVRNLRASLERVLATGAPDHMPVQKYDIRNPSGEFEERWWSPSNWPVRGPDGKVQHIIHHVEDVTTLMRERRRASVAIEAAEACEERVRTLLDDAPQKVWINRTDGTADFFNTAWRLYTGVGEPASDADRFEAIHPDDREAFLRARSAGIASGRSYALEFRLRRGSDGVYRRHLVEVAPVFDNDEVSAWIAVALDVEDVRRDEASAYASREEESLILQSAMDYAAIGTDLEGGITFWSPGAAAIFGYGEGEVLGRNIGLIFTPEDRADGVPEHELRAARNAESTPDVRWLLRKDGGRVFMTGATRALRTPAGDLRGFLKIARDDTETWRIDRRRRADAARFRAIRDTSVDAIVTMDETRIIRDVNPATEQMFGWRPEELIGQPVERLMVPEEASVHPDQVDAYLENGVARIIGTGGREVEAMRKDGTAFPVHLAIGEWRDEEGRRFFTGFMHDLTQRKAFELALSRSEEEFRLLADMIPQMVWVAGAEGKPYWFNRRWTEYLGVSREELPERHSEFVAPAVLKRLKKSFVAARAKGESWEETFPLRGADGRERWFLSRAEPLRDDDGRVVRWFGASTDITEQVEAEQTQKVLGQEISHRVKNSLAMVSGLLELQRRELGAQGREALGDAAQRVRTIARVHDLLGREVAAQQVDLAPFLGALSAEIAKSAPWISTLSDIEPAVVSSDQVAPIGLVVNELLTNAYKYAYPEGQAGEVRVTGAWAAPDRYLIEVADAGRGLPEGFDLARPGASLGVRVINALTHQLGGELSAENARPGARFTLALPFRRDRDARS